MLLGIYPTVMYARINDTFEISCYVNESDGKLNFFDGSDLVPESFIKVRCNKFKNFKYF